MYRMLRMLLLIALLGVVMVACAEKSPEEKVADMRARYTATVNEGGMMVKQVPLIDETMEEGMEGMEEVTAGEEAAGDEGEAMEGEEAMEEVPVRTEVTLDILVRNENRENLDQLTLDITQRDGAGNTKETYRVTIDASDIGPGPGTQVAQVLEDVDYEEGDAFAVEVRHPVPPEQRGEYPEFSAAAAP